MNSNAVKAAGFVLLLVAGTAVEGADLDVNLGPPQQTIKRGAEPHFLVSVSPTATPQRIMRFDKREDLRHNYAQLTVTLNGTRAAVPRIISDPGPTSERDYVQLNPGQNLVFDHDGMPYVLSKLPAGTYSAVVRLRADWGSEAVMSNIVSLTVEQ